MASRNRGMQVRQHVILREEPHLDAQIPKHDEELVQLFSEAFENILRLREFLLPSLDEKFLHFLLPVFRRQILKRCVKPRLVITAARIKLRTFGIHTARHDVWKMIRRFIRKRRRALALEPEDIIRPQCCNSPLQAIREHGQFFFHGRIEIRPAKLPCRHERAVLIDDDGNMRTSNLDRGKTPEWHLIRNPMQLPSEKIHLIHRRPPPLHR